MALVRMASEARRGLTEDSTVQAYKAEAEGHVYFYLDREDGGDPVPMRVDQVSLDLYWGAPTHFRQTIRGLRKRELLPVKDFRYYIDRLTAVQNGFGDVITIGEGRDVGNVLHPLAPYASRTYQYRTVDSVRVTVPTMRASIPVYEVEVRPRQDDQPGFVGSLFLDRRNGALTGMSFTFTPSSYVDPRVDVVRVELEHSLWEKSYWLPYRQIVEVRREIPEVDLPVGSVIRATLQVDRYELNPELPAGFFSGPALSATSYAATDTTLFRSGLMEHLADEGLSPVSMAQLKAEAQEYVRGQLVSGLPKTRLFTDRASSVIRANRMEGVHFGAGASFAPHPTVRVEGLVGYATATEAPTGSIEADWSPGGSQTTSLWVRAFGRSLRDLGPESAASGAVNTAAVLLFDRDYSDPHYASGLALGWDEHLSGGRRLRLTAGWEAHRQPPQAWTQALLGDGTFRPIWSATEGELLSGRASLLQRVGGLDRWGATLELQGMAGRWEGETLGELRADLSARLASQDLSRSLTLGLQGGRVWGGAPHQLLYFLGGRGTLPGHPLCAFGGKRYVLARLEAAATVVPGWLTARVTSGVGSVGRTPTALRDSWGSRPIAGVRSFVGIGVGTLHDLVRVDGNWGLESGNFEVVVSVDPRVRPYL